MVTTQIGDLLHPHRRLMVNFAVQPREEIVPKWQIEGAIGFRTVLQLGAKRVLP